MDRSENIPGAGCGQPGPHPEIALPRPLFSGTLIKRYKRFLADVKLCGGRVVTAHCPNSGSMKTCSAPGSRVMISRASSESRRTRWTWELILVGRIWVGTNTLLPNRLVEKALRAQLLPEFSDWHFVRREAPLGPDSRIDFLLERNDRPCYVEVKNVTMVSDGIAYFPDAVTTRGSKHLEALMRAADDGCRACMLYLIQRSDGTSLRPAETIDAHYAETLRRAVQNGVEALAYRSVVTLQRVSIAERVPIDLGVSIIS